MQVSTSLLMSKTYARNPVERVYADANAYVDRIQYKTATGIIGLNSNTDHAIFIFPNGKTIVSGRIIIDELWTERMTGRVGCSIMFPVNFLLQ